MIVVTNSTLCRDNFFDRIEEIAKGKPEAIILREKEMEKENFKSMAVKCKDICDKFEIPFIINHQKEIAKELKIQRIHLSYQEFLNLKEKNEFLCIGVSVHSVMEAVESAKAGAGYLIAGHIFETDCKKEVKPRGVEFLKRVCESVSIPVYAIGGIRLEHLEKIHQCKASGVCVMSEFMQVDNPQKRVEEYNKRWSANSCE